MLISTSGGDYEGYRLSGDITPGEFSNIFTVSLDRAQVNWTLTNDGDSYHMYFITQSAVKTGDENSVQAN